MGVWIGNRRQQQIYLLGRESSPALDRSARARPPPLLPRCLIIISSAPVTPSFTSNIYYLFSSSLLFGSRFDGSTPGRMPPSAPCRLLSHAAAANSSPHSVAWTGQPPDDGGGDSGGGSVAYPSHSVLNLATFDGGGGVGGGRIPTVRTTLRTGTGTNPGADPSAGDRAISCVAAAEGPGGGRSILATAFSDGTVNLWHRPAGDGGTATGEDGPDSGDGGEGWVEEALVGYSWSGGGGGGGSSGSGQLEAPPSVSSVADLSAVALCSSGGEGEAVVVLVATASVDGVHLHVRAVGASPAAKVPPPPPPIRVDPHPSTAVALHLLPGGREVLLVTGTASPRGNRIHVHTVAVAPILEGVGASASASASAIVGHGSLPGHQDWITCFAFRGDREGGGGFLLASGGHDARVRLWKFHAPTAISDEDAAVAAAPDADADADSDSEAEEDDLDETDEARLRIRHLGDGTETAVTLEALLIGHDEAVTSTSWRPPAAPGGSTELGDESPCLLTSSKDRTILLWMEEAAAGGDNGAAGRGGRVWVPVSRVGAAGGVLGGPIGSSLSGFVNAAFAPDGGSIIGHGYGGSLHFWSSLGRRDADDPESERWQSGACLTGHFSGVSDISWEPSRGQYLVSAGLDQTCRLWAEVPVPDSDSGGDEGKEAEGVTWHEVGRPQVHGFDTTAACCIPQHRLVSGADEKVVRVFEAPKATIRLLDSLDRSGEPKQGIANPPQYGADRPERGYLPSLGLSNRATAAEEVEEVVDGFPNDETSSPEKEILQLPTERDLGVTSLWPETRKLFGHHYEIVCLASAATENGEMMVASACKARDVENAAIRIFDIQTGECLQVLKGGHKSTVATLSFSSDTNYLISAGKDRRLCLWRRGVRGQWHLASAVNSAHKRIIWSAHFCPHDARLFATGARDGAVKIWRICEAAEGAGGDGGDSISVETKEVCKFEPSRSSMGGKDKPAVTAIAFAPASLSGSSDGDEKRAMLAIGMETGTIELWSVSLDETSEAAGSRFLYAIPSNLCHIATVKRLAFRPYDGSENITLASCGMDYGVRIFSIRAHKKI